MREPPITITCECGEVRRVPYGERWQCEACGRRWNTAQIPEDEYRGLLREMHRYRYQVIGFAAVMAAVFIPLIVLVSETLVFMAPVIVFGWLLLYMPLWRRKVRRAARNAPRWDLRPE